MKFLDAVSPRIAIISTDSAEEPDSPHPSVLGMLAEIGAETYVTENYDLGILLTVRKDGELKVENACIEKQTNASLEICALSAEEKQVVEILNYGTDPVDLGGFFLFSKEGSEIFVFPEGTLLDPGEKICIVGKNSTVTADFIWDEERPWSQTKKDTAVLYDKYGNILDEKAGGL